MTQNQRQDLFIEWDLYHPKQQETMIDEFRARFQGNYTKIEFFEFIKEKLQIEGYWRKIGLV